MNPTRTRLAATAILLVPLISAGALEPEPIPLVAGDRSVAVTADGVWQAMRSPGQATTSLVAEVSSPRIEEDQYAVVGEIRYQDVEGSGHLVMWNTIEDVSYFTKTIEEQGPLQLIRGSSDWRTFALPFFKHSAADVESLKIELVLDGAGTVMIRDAVLVRGDKWMAALDPDAWWPRSKIGLVGAIAGVSLGLLGGMVGLSSSRPALRFLARPSTLAMLSAGVICLIAIPAAFIDRQPGYVLYILLLVGFLATFLGSHTLWKLNRIRTEDELRRIESLDLAKRCSAG